LSTFFLLDETARKELAEGKSSIPFVLHDGCLVADPAVPESAVCFELDFILSLYARYGLDTGGRISYGVWIKPN
jgi:hypothetical protein